jgi:hypothetical protein
MAIAASSGELIQQILTLGLYILNEFKKDPGTIGGLEKSKQKTEFAALPLLYPLSSILSLMWSLASNIPFTTSS